MADLIYDVYQQLLSVRIYLIKLGPKRRVGEILEKKLKEAEDIKQKYEITLDKINDNLDKIDSKDYEILCNNCSLFEELYKEIEDLCKSSKSISKMEKFNHKVALSLLPVMNDEENTTKNLIDGIEYYAEELDSESQKKLISFVLRSRLSQSAKLLLEDSYTSVSELVKAMKSCLLAQKSATALQKKLLTLKQNDLSIANFGKELSEMFVNLTISQSQGDSAQYNILKKINENQAIRQFSDGLRNRRIASIISAQKFTSLKDAVQSAIEEDVATQSTSNNILTMRNNRGASTNRNFRGRGYNNRYQRGYRGRYNQVNQQRGGQRGGNNNIRGWHNRGSRSYYRVSNPQQNFNRGSYRGFSSALIEISIIIVTITQLNGDVVPDAPNTESNEIFQRDRPKDILEPELLPVLHGNDTRCRISEYLCANKKCVPINRFCDGSNDCGDSSDEPRHCTRCNRTYYGDIGRTYELELHRPREDLVPYVCLITITAPGGIHGDLVQVLFDSFTLGRFTSFTEDGCPDGYMQIQEASRPQVGGSWCGTSWGPSIYYSETKSITLIIRLLHLSKDQNNYNFDFRMAYKVLRREYATVRYGGSPPSERPFFKLRPMPYPVNISRGEDPVLKPKPGEYYLGDLISGTYCSRIFSDCDRKNCRLQSPNFPGVYPRNLTCYYAVRQHEVPQGKHALIVVKQPNGQLVSIRSQKALYAAQQERGNNGRELKFWQQCDEVQDYVTVYDGYTTRDPVILRFCGGGVSVPEAISSGPELLVEFTTSPFGTFLQPATAQSLHGFQLEVEVRFVDQQSPTYAKNKRACEFWIRGTGRGVLEHPQHSLPPNTTCLYHMQGIDTSGPSGRNIIYRRTSFSAPRFRVWFSVLKFYVTNALNPNLPEDEYCGSHLNIWDGPMRISPGCSDIFCDKERSVQMSRATSPQSVIVGRPPTNATLVARFCRERAPRTCEHALLRKSRACARTESFLSKGDSLTLELKLTQGTALKPIFFKALYEFVDLHQDGEPWGRGLCSRRFASRSFPEAPPDPPVTFSSPRDVFLYGRGGSRNISCTYRFEANPGEVVRLRVWGIRSGGRLCRSVHSAHSPWYRCAGDPTAAVRIFDRPWKSSGPGIPRDCLCSDLNDYEFTSTGTVAELKFDVVNMSAIDDFRSFGFEASVEFVRLDTQCESSHRVFGPSGNLRLSSNADAVAEQSRCEHRPWLIDPSPGRYLYLQIRGRIIKEPILDNFTLLNNITVAPDLRHLCRTQNRLAVYAGGLSPIFICPDPPDDQYEETVEIFSDGWSEEVDHLARHVLAPPPSPDRFDLDWPRSLSVELIAADSGSYYVTWLELSRRHASERGGVFALSGDCEYRCASLDACIAPDLWCDGIAQCPQGEDERLSQCSALLRVPAHYAAAMLAFSILAAFAVIAAARSCRRRRSALQQRLKSLSSDTAIFDEKEVIC